MLLSTNPQEKLAIRVAIQSDIQDLSKTLFANNNQVEPFWNDSGVLLTEAIILAMLEDAEIIITKESTSDQERIKALLQTHLPPPTKFNLASVTVIATMGQELINWFKQRSDTSLAKITANQLLHGESKTLASILMTMSTNLSIFKNELIRNLTCNNDLNLHDFITKPTALFIVVPDENHNFYVFISLLISQIYKFLTQAASKTYPGKLTWPVYFLCDEFGNIPPIPNIESMITIARSRNIFFQLIIQELKQLENKYNKAIADIIFAENQSIATYLYHAGDPNWDGTVIGNTPPNFNAPDNIKEWNMFAAMIGSCFMLYICCMLGMLLIQKIIELFFLFIISPVIMTVMILDDSKAANLWKDMVIAKFLASSAVLTGFFVFIAALQAIATSGLSGLNSGGMSKQFFFLLFTMGGGMATLYFTSMIGEFIGERVGISEARQNFQSVMTASAGLAGTTGAVLGFIGLKKNRRANKVGIPGTSDNLMNSTKDIMSQGIKPLPNALAKRSGIIGLTGLAIGGTAAAVGGTCWR